MYKPNIVNKNFAKTYQRRSMCSYKWILESKLKFIKVTQKGLIF